MKRLFIFILAAGAAGNLLADTAEIADRYDLESVWKPGGRTFRPMDYPFSPRPLTIGGPDDVLWGNEGFIFRNPRMRDLERYYPEAGSRRTAESPAPSEEELLQALRDEQAAADALKKEVEALRNQVEELTIKAEDEEIKRRQAELQLSEAEASGSETGPRITVTAAGEPVSAQLLGMDTYLVGEGECLWTIAGKPEVYGNPYRWLLLYHANRDQIFEPDLIYPGMVLIVPRYAGLETVGGPAAVPEPAGSAGTEPTED
ncbi:MAG TPA: hypothetical protein PLI51_08425 [bacterium]|nr:hypothetical protein [bacterium]HPQ66735.1 hypothetical protein [bacterium]